MILIVLSEICISAAKVRISEQKTKSYLSFFERENFRA
jgi:hypothetical protein